MNNELPLNRFTEKIHHELKRDLLPLMDDPHSKFIHFLREYEKETREFFHLLKKQKSGEKADKILTYHIDYRKKLLHHLNSWIPQKIKVNDQIIEFNSESHLIAFLSAQPSNLIIIQSKERFLPQKTDNQAIHLLKFLKRSVYNLHALPVKITNKIRNWRKKQPKPLPVWKQNIPVLQLTQHYYQVSFMQQFVSLYDDYMKELNKLAAEVWQADTLLEQELRKKYTLEQTVEIPLDELEKNWENNTYRVVEKNQVLYKQFWLSFDEELKKTRQLFNKQVEIAGTIEFSNYKHRKIRRKRSARNIKKKYRHNLQGRFNTLFALSDDWKFNQEIFILSTGILFALEQFSFKYNKRVENVIKSLKQIPDFLIPFLKNIQPGDLFLLRKQIHEIKKRTSQELSGKIITDVSNSILDQNFPLVLDETEKNMTRELASMNNRRVLIPGFDPSLSYPQKSLPDILPREVIDFEMIPQLKKSIHQAKTSSIDQLEKLNKQLQELGQMVEYNLDSVIVMIDRNPEEAKEKSFEDAKAALKRALKNISDTEKDTLMFFNHTIKDIEEQTWQFNESLLQLVSNKKVEEIKYRIAKAKALEKSELFIQYLQRITKISLAKSKKGLYFTFQKVQSGVESIKGRLGIQVIPENITTEITEFLVSGEKNIQKLPFVYRRLFLIEPLKDPLFYLPRKEASDKLSSAFNTWKNGSFTPALIHGEKGSGVSSFIHLFVKENIQQKPVVFSVIPKTRILGTDKLLALLGQSFTGEPFQTVDQLSEFVEKSEPFVAFVDKLHMLYLRNTGGFHCLKKFFEIISQTSKKIFWICSVGVYAGLFLDKSIGLYSYFPVVIPMKNITPSQITDIIMMRHKASGYSLQFLPSENDLKDRVYQKKNEAQQQLFLKDKYFTSLNKHTQSNIAFALQMWIRCTEKAKDSKIFIESLDKVDFTFMHNLSTEIVFGLHALILHEFLDVTQLSMVMNISKRQAYLLLMRLTDRGVVEENMGFYTIHPLLYRQTIVLLKNKNLIYE